MGLQLTGNTRKAVALGLAQKIKSIGCVKYYSGEDMSDADDVVEELRSQVFDDRVYVFTPKGDVIDLPVGSTTRLCLLYSQ